jgi:predicted amidophosphoribosyltransferase
MVLLFILILALLSLAILHELEARTESSALPSGACPGCASPVEHDWLVCPRCRTLVREGCPGCGGHRATYHSFCPHCGVRRGEQP